MENIKSQTEGTEPETKSNGLAQPDLDPAGKGVVIVATLFLCLVGLVF